MCTHSGRGPTDGHCLGGGSSSSSSNDAIFMCTTVYAVDDESLWSYQVTRYYLVGLGDKLPCGLGRCSSAIGDCAGMARLGDRRTSACLTARQVGRSAGGVCDEAPWRSSDVAVWI